MSRRPSSTGCSAPSCATRTPSSSSPRARPVGPLGHAEGMSSASSEKTVDLVGIGAGPGGEALASGAAGAGLDVVVVDKHLVGGECPYYGCIPSKMMLRAADTLAEAGRAATLAGDATVTPSWAPVAARISSEATSGWDDTIAVERLQDAG